MNKSFVHLDRFWSKVNLNGPQASHMNTNCWLWTAATNGKYGVYLFVLGTKQQGYAHRYIWNETYGTIPNGLEIDHICFNKLCVRPDHLELVTHKENMQRMGDRITHCPRGHEYSPKNTYYRKRNNGRKQCRACDRETKRAKGLVKASDAIEG